MIFRLLVLVCFTATALHAYEHGDAVPADFKMPEPLSLEESLKTLATKPGLSIELVAAEPLTMDPVAIDFGPDGKLWIVEMADYPLGLDGKNKPGGRVRFLTDSDGDGKFDKSTLFLKDLNFPTGVKAWRNGAIVVAAPEIFYAEDTTGDGKADKRELLFHGFKEGNQQHRVNGLVWGLDNYLHLANGDSGGKVKSTKTGETLDLGSFDLKIRPDTGEMAKTSGRTQYGRVRDDFGNWFGCSNSKPIFQFVLRQEILARNPHVVYPPAAVSITEQAWAPEIFPTSKPALRYNDPHARSRITSACGLGIYRDAALGVDYYGNAFICEPVHNLVHRRILKRPGGETIFKAERADDEQKSEFFTSTDPWVRPVQATTGPDGALWIVDMHRFVIEHPEWIPEPWQKVLDLRAGSELGRIYRIVNDNCGPAVHDAISQKSDTGLVTMLASSNGRIRDMAHQLLYERKTSPETFQDHLKDDARLVTRLHMISLCWPDAEIQSEVYPWSELGPDATDYEIAHRLSWIGENAAELYDQTQRIPRATSDRLISGLFETAIALNSDETFLSLLDRERFKSPSHQERYATLLTVLDRRKIALGDIAENRSEGVQSLLTECAQYSKSAQATVLDVKSDLNSRIGAVSLLGRAKEARAEDIESLRALITPATEPGLAIAAVRRLREMDDYSFIQQLPQVSSIVRKTILETALSDSKGAGLLLKKLDSKELAATLIDAASRSRLTSFPNGGIRKQAQQLFESGTNKDRAAVLQKYAPALTLKGNVAEGRAHFETACAACHKIDNLGVSDLGADLTALTDKSSDAFLTAILDPNRAVEDKYMLTSVTLTDGTLFAGMIQGESGDTISLKALDGSTRDISRNQISQLENTGRSAMPEGLEATLNVQQMADLIAFLQSATK